VQTESEFFCLRLYLNTNQGFAVFPIQMVFQKLKRTKKSYSRRNVASEKMVAKKSKNLTLSVELEPDLVSVSTEAARHIYNRDFESLSESEGRITRSKAWCLIHNAHFG
jgi:hypothetical protein